MDSTQNKTPSIKQQEQFIEFIKQNDPEVIDYAEDLLHGIYPQRIITEEHLINRWMLQLQEQLE